MKVLITGVNGFIGQNLVAWLGQREDVEILGYDIDNTPAELDAYLAEADFVFHLAGVNRPKSQDEFVTGNSDFTHAICERLATRTNPPPLLLSSSIQAVLDNPYGRSKHMAEEVVREYGEKTGARVIIYRLKNVFGKWSRPNYNTVVATFCHQISHDLPITISNPAHELELIHIDDVVGHFASELDMDDIDRIAAWQDVVPSYTVTLGRLAEIIHSFRAMRETLNVPDLSDPFIYKLYGMYLTYLDEDNFAYDLTQRCDERGCLAEFVKSETFGQVFVSRTKPGITRGHHYHHAKTEKFLVLEGEAIVRFRHIQRANVIEYFVRGEAFNVVDIPPGYTHSIENVGKGELVTLFWASEIFDPSQPDTIYEKV